VLEIYQAVGLRFLSRLFKTASVQPLALNLFSTFSQHPKVAAELATSSAFASMLPQLFELVLKLEGEPLADAAHTLMHVLANEDVQVTLPSDEMIASLLQRCDVIEEPGKVALLGLLSQILRRLGSRSGEVAMVIVPPLARLFRTSNTQVKFQALKALAFLFRDHQSTLPHELFQPKQQQQQAQQQTTTNNNDQQDWTMDVRRGLTQIVTNRTSDEYRFLALSVICCMLERAGAKWAIRPTEGQGRPGQFVQLMINVVSVEVRVLLMIMGGPHPRKELTQTIVACFTILELAMSYLIDETSGWGELEGELMLSLQQKFSEIYSEVFLFLREMRDNETTKGELIVACVRAVGAWVSEETEALQDEFQDLLPWLLQVPAFEGVDPLLFLAPCVLQLALDETTAIQCIEWCSNARSADRILGKKEERNIYIYIDREREREIYIYIYIYI